MDFKSPEYEEEDTDFEFDDTCFFRVRINYHRVKNHDEKLNNVPQDESGLCNDLGFLAHLPELCDITFMVGQDKEPVCAVRAVLGISQKQISKTRPGFNNVKPKDWHFFFN